MGHDSAKKVAVVLGRDTRPLGVQKVNNNVCGQMPRAVDGDFRTRMYPKNKNRASAEYGGCTGNDMGFVLFRIYLWYRSGRPPRVPCAVPAYRHLIYVYSLRTRV